MTTIFDQGSRVIPLPFRPAALLARAAALLALWLGLGLGIAPAQATPIPFGNRTVQITAREQPVAGFLQDLFGAVGVPVSVSPGVKNAVNGHFEGPAEKVYRSIARAFNLVEYYDGSVVYVYSAQDMATRTLPGTGEVSGRIVRAIDELGMTDERNKVRVSSEGTVTATGTQRFLEQVEELARSKSADARTAAASPSSFKIFYLRYGWAQDVTVNLGGRQVLLPGVASTVRALMADSASSQVAPATLERPASNTVPGMRDKAADRQPTLGAMNASSQQPSAPALATAFGGMPGAAAAANTASTGAAGVQPEARQVRVEADARLNAVIVRDTAQRLPQYEQLIAALDVEPQEVEIEATIIDVDTDKVRQLGVDWHYNDVRASSGLTGLVASAGGGGFVSTVLGDAGHFLARINALQEKGAAKVVSSPQVLTLSNVEAVFDSSQTFYVRVAGRDDANLFNVAAGTTLRVTPHVFKDNGEVRIKMLVSVEDGSLSNRVVDTLPVVERSSINTQAMIFEGESLLVGGITRESTSENTSQVPVLGDVPVLGALFRNKQSNATRVERMILISPRLAGGHRPAAVAKSASAPVSPPAAPAAPAPSPTPATPAAPQPTDLVLRVQDSRGPRTSYGRGEVYAVDVEVPRTGYLYCYLVDARGQWSQFFPNPAQRNAAVSAGSRLAFPGRFDFRLSASRIGGTETVACVETRKDLGFEPLAAATAGLTSTALREQVSRVAGQDVVVGMFDVKAP